MQEDNQILNIVTRGLMLVIIMVFITVMIRFLTKNILVDIMNVDNPIIQEIAEEGVSKKSTITTIDWKKEYPVQESDINTRSESTSINIVNKYTNIINKIKNQLEKYSGEFLFGYEKIVEIAKGYENLINWNLITNTDSDTPIYIGDEYWSVIQPQADFDGKVNKIIEFNKYLQSKGIKDLIYVQAPKKTQDINEEMLKAYKDYADENIDMVVETLKENNIKVLDLRQKIRDKNISTKTLFFKTDHHWTSQGGLWAAKYIANEINGSWNMNIDLNLYNSQRYYTISLENNYLGSEGRKLTLAKVKPERFDLVIPSFETSLTVDIPELEIEGKNGNLWETLIEKDCLTSENYYRSCSYDALGYNNKAFIHVTNNNANIDNKEKILLLADSFSGALLPYISLGVKDIYRIDLRDFDGSIKDFIDKNNITKVIMLYYPDTFYNVEAEEIFLYE